MEQQRVRKTYKYQLMPTPDQEQVLATVLWRCRDVYNAGLEPLLFQQVHHSVRPAARCGYRAALVGLQVGKGI